MGISGDACKYSLAAPDEMPRLLGDGVTRPLVLLRDDVGAIDAYHGAVALGVRTNCPFVGPFSGLV